MNFFKNKFKTGSFIATFLTLLFAPVKTFASILDLSGVTSGLMSFGTWIIETIVFAINYLTGMLVTLGGGLVNFSLDLNTRIVSDENQLVELGWQITRDIANLGFVLIIIIIALATIIRYREYGAKKFLPKLIAAALIVNFSLTIGFAIIGFSDTFTGFFINSQIGGAEQVGQTITAAFAPQKFYTNNLSNDENSPVDDSDSGIGIGPAFFNAIAGMLFAIIFQFIAFATLLGLSIMLIIRFVYLSILLIVAPLALLMWASPGLQHLFNKWWSKFLKWTFFAPAVSFFVYLSLLSLQKMASIGSSASVGQGFAGSGFQDIIIQGSQMLIVSGLMIGGLIAAESMSVAGASSTMKGVKSAWGGTKKFAQKGGRRLRDRALTAGTGEKDGEKKDSYAQRAATVMTKIPVAGRAFKGTAEKIGKQKENLKEQTESRQKEMSGITDSDLTTRASRVNRFTNPVEVSALAKEMAKRGKTDSITDQMMTAAETTGTKKEIVKEVTEKRPDKASDFGEDISKVMNKMSSGKANEIEAKAFDNSEVVINLSNGHLGNIGSKGSTEQKQKILDKIEELEKNGNDQEKRRASRIKKYMQDNTNWQAMLGEDGDQNEQNDNESNPNQNNNNDFSEPTFS